MSETLTFRAATAADLPAIVALIADDGLGRGREKPGLPLDQRYTAAFEAVERDPNQLLAVAERAGVVVGTLQLTFIPGVSRLGAWRGQIEAVRIAASERGSGLGQQMMQWAITECRARGCSLVQLTSDKSRDGAHRFYERLGFVASHEGFKREIDFSSPETAG
jgi:ribosomal protein S18 acetylase RimI-like enzyme